MIRIKELFWLQNIRKLRLIAGQDGLERTVTAAVLFEYDPSRMQLPDFYRGDLVVTTLAYARGDAQLVTQSLIALMNQGIAGLLVKTAYFSELPQAVVSLADRLGTPLLLFDDTYIEEVILEVTDLIRGRRHFAGYEKELDTLMHGQISTEQIRENVQRLDPIGSASYRLYALYPQERMPALDEKIYGFLCENTEAAHRFICMEWRRMLLVLCHLGAEDVNEEEPINTLLQHAQVDHRELIVGISEIKTEQTAFGLALCEAIYSAKTAKLLSREKMSSRELGLYAYLFPMSENVFVCDQCRRALNAIREYDAQNHTNLEQTARVYVSEGMEISSAAKVLFQHPNTVRYRLTKIQKLMDSQDNSLFAPMLSLMVNLSHILEEPDGRSLGQNIRQ